MESYIQLLQHLLQPQTEIRQAAEETFKIQQLQDYNLPIFLLEITGNKSLPLEVRQQSITLLRQHIDINWSSINKDFIVEVDKKVKQKLRQDLFPFLGDESSKITNGVAYCISTIAKHDWPEEWAEFCPTMSNFLKNNSSIPAALKVLNEFSQSITVDNLNVFVSTFFEPLANIVLDDKRDFKDKTNCMEIFWSCFDLSTSCDKKSKDVMAGNLEPVIDMINIGLKTESSNNPEYFGFQTSIIKLTKLLLSNFSKLLLVALPDILNPIWNLFTNTVDFYQTNFILSDSSIELNAETADGGKIGIGSFLCETIDFLQEVTTTKKGRKLMDSMIVKVLSKLLILSQISASTLDEWDNDLEVFQNDQDELLGISANASQIRVNAIEAISESICCEYIGNLTPYINNIYNAIFETIKTNNNWQLLEASSLILTNLFEQIYENDPEKIAAPDKNFDNFFNSIILPSLHQDINKYNTGRMLIFASKFCQKIDPNTNKTILNLINSNLVSGQVQSKILAISALHNMVDNLPASNRVAELEETISSNIQSILNLMEICVQNGPNSSSSTDLLSTCLQILDALFEIDDSTTAQNAEKTLKFLILILKTNKTDPLLAENVLSVLEKLTKCSKSAKFVTESIGVTLNEILIDESEEDVVTLKATCIEAIEYIGKSVRKSGGKSIDKDTFAKLMSLTFVSSIQLALNPKYKNESVLVQNCIAMCKIIFSLEYGSEILINLTDQTGKSYIQYVLELISFVLDPEQDESLALDVGKLITLLVSKCINQLREHDLLNGLLTACLKKLENSSSLSTQQSLLLVFAQLMCENIEAVLNFTKSINATQFLIVLFCEKYEDFYGFLERKIGTIAMCKLADYIIENDIKELQNFVVNGDQIIDINAKRSTRSSRNVTAQFQKLPLILKIFKSLLSEHKNSISKPEILDSQNSDRDEYSEDDTQDEDDLLNGAFNYEEDQEDLCDEFEMEDNIFAKIDTDQLLETCLKKFNLSEDMVGILKENEIKVCKEMGLF